MILTDPVAGLVFVLCLVAASASDLLHRKVPNRLNAIILALGVGWQVWRLGWPGLPEAGLGVAAAFACVIVPFAFRVYRGGDAKLVMALGAWLGAGAIVRAFLAGAVLGAAVAVGRLITVDAATRRRMIENLRLSLFTRTLPAVEDGRPAALHVPMALAFSGGAVVAQFWR